MSTLLVDQTDIAIPKVKIALRSSLCPVLAFGLLGVGSVKVWGRVSESTSCVGQWHACFRCQV
jgi:hypothetical protein